MRRLLLLYVLVLSGVLLTAGVVARTQPEPDPIPPRTGQIILPDNYRETFVRYLTVDRSDDLTRDLYIHPDILTQLERGEPLPEGTQIVIEAYRGTWQGDRLVKQDIEPFIHVAEKRSNWSLTELPVSSHVGDWNFASFESDTRQPSTENLTDCFNCHDDAASITQDFVFSRRAIDQFALTGDPLYQFCPRPDRIRC